MWFVFGFMALLLAVWWLFDTDSGPGQPLVSFDAPGSGTWLLEADVTYDLERGAYAAYALLEVP